MKRVPRFRAMITGVCCAALLSGQLVHAAGPTPFTTSRVADVALNPAGELHGQVLNVQGVPQVNAKVVIGQPNQRPLLASTDAAGRFTVRGLPAGVYQVQTAHSSGVYRVWAPRTAPPSAQAGVLVVDNQEVVRGYGGALGAHSLANPWVMGLIVAGAIAIPLAVDSGS